MPHLNVSTALSRINYHQVLFLHLSLANCTQYNYIVVWGVVLAHCVLIIINRMFSLDLKKNEILKNNNKK